MNNNKICVFDLETDGTNPNICNPVQIASLIIDPRTLQIVEHSEFVSDIRPQEYFDNPMYCGDHKDTIDWHAKNYQTTSEKIVDKWRNAPPEKDVWDNFKTYLLKYHKGGGRKSKWTAPIAAGHNILRFDMPIMERLGVKHKDVDKGGDLTLFSPRDKIDSMLLCFNWFENISEVSSYSLDFLRGYFGYPTGGAHDALEDVRFTAEMICRFMRLTRNTSSRVVFKGALAK